MTDDTTGRGRTAPGRSADTGRNLMRTTNLDLLRAATRRMRRTESPTWVAVALLLDRIADKEEALMSGPFGDAIALSPEPLFELHPFGLAEAIIIARQYLTDPATAEATPCPQP